VVQGVLFDEKKRRSKISWHCPFNDNEYREPFKLKQSNFRYTVIVEIRCVNTVNKFATFSKNVKDIFFIIAKIYSYL
jgi:hypothetical protein